MSVDAPRPTKVVLADALAELQAREARLKRLELELSETRAAIKALRKLVGDAPLRVAESRPAAVEAPTPMTSEDRDEIVLRVIGANQPCARATLLQRTDLGPGALKAVLDRLREAAKIRMVGEKAAARYLLAEPVEDANAA